MSDGTITGIMETMLPNTVVVDMFVVVIAVKVVVVFVVVVGQIVPFGPFTAEG